MSIYYINSGGLFTMAYDDSHMKLAERIIRDKFERIKNTKIPEVRRGMHCGFCDYDKFDESLGDTPCNFYHNQVVDIGIDLVTEIYGNPKTLTNYSGAAGRQ